MIRTKKVIQTYFLSIAIEKYILHFITAVVESSSDGEDIEDQTEGDHRLEDEEYPISEDDEYVDDEEEDESDNSEDEEAGDSKWAATMAKLLKQKDTETLSKAKKDKEIEKKKEKPTYKFEIVGESGEKKDEERPDDKKLVAELIRQKLAQKKERKKTILGLRQIPAVGDYEREKTLKKIATKGCVQLFNAVRAQQKDITKKLQEAGKLESKRDKVLKNINRKEFLNALMSGPRAKSEFVDNLVKDELKDEVKSEEDESDDEKSTWSALKPGFLTGKKSGWDKEDEEDDEANIDDSKMDTDDSE